MKRISWLDRRNMYAKIHATEDDGVSTICGKSPLSRLEWKFTEYSPEKMHGRSRYCGRCFEKGSKTVGWFSAPVRELKK